MLTVIFCVIKARARKWRQGLITILTTFKLEMEIGRSTRGSSVKWVGGEKKKPAMERRDTMAVSCRA